MLLFTEDKTALLLRITEDFLGDVLMISSKIKDIMKAIEQLIYEIKSKYIPWIVYTNISEIRKHMNRKIKIIPPINDLRLIKIVLEKGEIGEQQKILKKCALNHQNGLEFYFFLTDKSLYILDFNYDLYEQIRLSDIKKIETNEQYNKFVFTSMKIQLLVYIEFDSESLEEIFIRKQIILNKNLWEILC